MAKELPYFKFFPAEWMKGNVTICSMAAQGLFSNICNYYWMKDCNMSLTHVQQRFNKHQTELEELFNNGIIKKDNDDNIIIDFLDEQMSEFVELSEKRSKAGRSSGESRRKKPSNKCSTSVQHLPNYKEKDKEKDNEIEYGINTENFKKQWARWKKYLSDQHDFIYHSTDSEQTALMDLVRMAGTNESTAINLINNAIAKGWKAIYKNDKIQLKEEPKPGYHKRLPITNEG